MYPFTYTALPAKVIFGYGTSSQVAQQVKELGCSRALVLTTPQQVAAGEKIKEFLGDLAVGIYTNATMHTPINVTNDALAKAKELKVDCVVSVGGGSTIGLGKALALHSAKEGKEHKIKQIVIPTTYAGSEATPIIGQTENDSSGNPLKTTQKTLLVLPETILYDISLTLSLPASMTVTSGLNAIAHAVEALWAPSPNPIVSSLALQGIEHISKALPVVTKDLENKDARSDLLYGAYCCGAVLGAVGMSLHHKLCHTLGGSFGMPHSETHTIILPHAVAYNAPYAESAIQQIHKSLSLPSSTSVAQGLYDLAREGGVAVGLKELGFEEEDLERAAEIAVKAPYPNPAPLEKEKILKLLTDAYNGTRPE
ncbi:maleylacetate reductase [Sporobolomyces salmoneus]|uniref:maleylacetate reductase n=1 Tax=Sporobolomyces salmoneus TaxID=183962 RepID=UPI003178E938